MKQIFLTILALSLTTVSFSQKAFILAHQDKQGFAAFAAGTSLPVGAFGSCTPTDDRACMATQGMAINLSVGYRLLGPVGLMLRGELHRNAVDTQAMIGEAYPATVSNRTAWADDWSVMTVMGGPYVSIPMGRFALDVRALAGQGLATLPSTGVSGTVGRMETSVRTIGSQSAGLALGGGLSLRYRLGRALAVQLNADYSRASFQFENVSTTSTTPYGSQFWNHTSERVVSTISASAGIVILFRTKYHPF